MLDRKALLSTVMAAIVAVSSAQSGTSTEEPTDDRLYSQSPIDINTRYVRQCPMNSCPLSYSNYWGTNTTAKIRNTGRTVSITLEKARTPPTLEGGPLSGKYVFEELHFHWGADDSEGSEHTINGNCFPMEAHAVHYKAEYKSLDKALAYKDGVAVVALFFVNFRKSGVDNPALSPLTDILYKLNKTNDTTELGAEDALSWFMPRALPTGFFTYQGSLTTPPYTEAVTWIVYPEPVFISTQQLQEFRRIQKTGNFRSTQRVNGRAVYYCANLLCTQNFFGKKQGRRG